jgi:predicted nucleic acid-binding protein
LSNGIDTAASRVRQARDQDWSFTDCTSLVLMRELRLKRVLTTDHHFTRMGFTVLPEEGR